ncbi:MAG: hypothetical protein IPK26_27875 [Planctomycetes bacterium]|nr:hypothetical protein [Planctomycetota bacterium]
MSTEIESTRSALRSLTGRIHWVGGGKSKDGDFQTVADGVVPHIAARTCSVRPQNRCKRRSPAGAR